MSSEDQSSGDQKSWSLTDEEFESACGMNAEERYEYFINKTLEHEVLWSLKNDDGWVLGEATDDLEAIPVWPHPRFAQQCATEAWADHVAESISLNDFLDRFIPGMLEDKRVLAIFEVPGGETFVTDPGAVGHDLDITVE